MRRLLAVAIGSTLALCPMRSAAGSGWGSQQYGDPPGWCTNFSDMWTATVVTSDPHVGNNPEQDTFFGYHANPGYDDWYGYFYGDFRGSPGDESGWVKLLHEDYPNHYHWNFAANGWEVHGHAKQYIAYYNWTFGGQCRLGFRGNSSPPPFMADQYGYPVVDIYVDSKPPYPPWPRIAEITASSVAFTWDPVADQGDGAGRDFFASGMDHYTSWLTLNDSPNRLQFQSTSSPRTLRAMNLTPQQTACVHVQAFDRLQNATAEQIACSVPLLSPHMPVWPANQSRVVANPMAPGLVGLDTWFWVSPAPSVMTARETHPGIDYTLTAAPVGADWDFGDGTNARFPDVSGFGQAYPRPSSVSHVYEAHSQAGYGVHASVRYSVTWTARIGGRVVGPYPLGLVNLGVTPLQYSVEQAQPELTSL
jgi:hypothetical protein